MYKSLLEKALAFNQKTIDTLEELVHLVDDLKGQSSLRFRGVCESKYTMLTSLQRKCPAKMKGRQLAYLASLLNRVMSDSQIRAYFQNNGITINEISCLALMQHQGLPTPLLDFSTDIRIALSFAADGVTLVSSEYETDGYVSLYVFDIAIEYEIGSSIQQVYVDGMMRAKQMLEVYTREHPDQQVDSSLLFDINSFVKWEDIKDCELAFLEYQALAPGLVTMSGDELDLSNPNLDRQKGCFLLNLYDEKMPLEENWNMRTIQQCNAFWAKGSSGVHLLPFSGVMTRDKITCYDIKKEVIRKWAGDNALTIYDKSDETISIKERLNKILSDLNSGIEDAKD